MGVKIIGVGKCLPERVITNDEMSQYIDTTHEWIVERTGIHQRHVATTESSLDLASAAAEEALEGIDKETIDLVIVATITPYHVTPSMAAEVKMRVGLPNAVAFDINAACSGFVYGLWIAESLMKGSAAGGSVTNGMKRALVIGTERLTRVTNWVDRGICILFGDGSGAAESVFCPVCFSGFSNMTAMSTRTNPDRCSTPFDLERDGFILGEGAAILVLEEMEHAKAMRMALADAGITADDIDYINAHGTGTPYNDAFETIAVKKVFGEDTKVPISSTKSMTGHLLGAAGSLETVICAKTITEGFIPPTIGLEKPDPELGLDYVPNVGRAADVKCVLSNSLGFGGHNGSLIVKRFEE